MKLLRHILSHLILISFLIGLVSVFYYRTLLLPSDVVIKVNGIVKEVYPPALAFVSKRDYFWSIRGERIVSFDDLTVFKNKKEVVNNSNVIEQEKAEVIYQDVANSEEETKPEVISLDIAKVDVEIKPEVIVEKEVESKKDNVVLTDKVTKNNPIVIAVKEDKPLQEVIVKEVESIAAKDKGEETPVVVKDRDTSSERDLLISARNAFNQGDMLKSESYYIQLTELDHDNADIFGELGNVYYSQGKWDAAGQAYYEAAVRLIEEGKHNQVVYLQRVISGLNTEHAEKLAQIMRN